VDGIGGVGEDGAGVALDEGVLRVGGLLRCVGVGGSVVMTRFSCGSQVRFTHDVKEEGAKGDFVEMRMLSDSKEPGSAPQ